MPVKKLPYLQFYTSDYVRDTRILSLEARAIWMDILCLMHDGDRRGYLTRAGTPLTAEQVARFSGCSAAAAESAIQEIINAGVASKDDDGTIYSRRIVRDEKRRRESVSCGRKGGNPALNGGVKGGVNPSLNHPDNSPLVSGIGNGIGFDSSSPEGGAGGNPAGGFAAFWAAYPRKIGKALAAESWLRLNPSHELQATILAALESQRRSEQWTRDGGRFVPHPTTWLNQGRWTDELPPPAPAGTPASAGPKLNPFAAKIKQAQDEERRRNGGGGEP